MSTHDTCFHGEIRIKINVMIENIPIWSYMYSRFPDDNFGSTECVNRRVYGHS